MRTLHLELDSDLEANLAAAANMRGIAVEEFAPNLIRSAVHATPAKPTLSSEEFFASLDALQSKEPEHLRSQTFSREFIYSDHG